MKAYYRLVVPRGLFSILLRFISKDSRATCYLQTLRPQFAVVDFKKILAIEPKNETVRQQMVSTQKLIRRTEFEKVGLKNTVLI